MKKKILYSLWEGISFMAIVTLIQIYLFKRNPSYSLLSEGLLGGVIMGILQYKYEIFKR